MGSLCATFVTVYTGSGLLKKRNVPIGEYLWVTIKESKKDPEEIVIVKVLSGNTSFLTTGVYASSIDWYNDELYGYLRIYGQDIVACRKLCTQDLPLIINWSWISEAFKREMFGVQ